MGKRPKTKMPIEQRAKQFMPFAALKGFDEEIRKRERKRAERKILSPDRQEEIDWKLKQAVKDSNVSVMYFSDGEYVMQSGFVIFNDSETKRIGVSDSVIEYGDICDVEIL